MNVGFVSLGCSKNLVDTEMMIGLFKDKGFKIVNDPKDAEIIVVNTCGFIEPAYFQKCRDGHIQGYYQAQKRFDSGCDS